MDAILRVDNLTKQYADFKLDHVSFSVPKGTIMGLIGENGAGKSTTINAILDLIRKDDGTVTFWGQELSSSKQLKEDIGVVFDGINFYETLTPAKVGKGNGNAQLHFHSLGQRFNLFIRRKLKAFQIVLKQMRVPLFVGSTSNFSHFGRCKSFIEIDTVKDNANVLFELFRGRYFAG